ncbi:Nudix family hydrolase [Chitinimonas sp. BJB300]|uniref:Nudix family hydrolase n=1 Tax=Chitinimonas sp. BJB300 TaxID=1559339 RepID=UPI000C116C7C|nr:Nudix family hydrolase [Chitinimonas sp. BJB300]PHV12308.1 DNA mismatch repair protein MutT [Chitinimonas sp. BJB300]TSJ88169.1 Nudix family hydrolase [Chitinimonas sp. BJB300]
MNITKITHVAAGILIQPSGQFLLGSRPEGKPYAGWWEFPGGKLENGETPLDALKRELHEEMGITVETAQPWLVQVFTYPHATVRLNFFKVTNWQGEPQPHEGQAFAWQVPGALTVDPVLPANTPILRGLQLPPLLAFSNVAELGADAWLTQLQTKLQAGLRWLVLREPQLDAISYAELAQQTLALTASYSCNVLLHGATDQARELGAAGVHLPARQLLQTTQRPDGWCGASVHNVTELAKAAELGLDYVVLGTIKPSLSHPGSATLGWEGFSELVSQGWPFPIYGIGGLTEFDLVEAQAAGGQGVAALRAAWQ